jgi:hypothetical protein
VLPSDFFLTIAEVSLGLVGFSAVVVALRQIRDVERSKFQHFMARMLIEAGFTCLFLALLPLLLELLGVPSARRWQLCCAALGVLLIIMGTAFVFRRRPFVRVSPARPWAFYTRVAVNHVLGFTALLSSVGLGFASGPGLYALGIAWLFFVAGLFLILVLLAAEGDE